MALMWGWAMRDVDVRVETVELDASGDRQIRSRTRATERLAQRRPEIQAAIVQTSEIAQEALGNLAEPPGWKVASLKLTFGVTLAAEAGVIVSKASAEASFEVTLTVERTG